MTDLEYVTEFRIEIRISAIEIPCIRKSGVWTQVVIDRPSDTS